MNENLFKTDTLLIAKQWEVINICYDRLIDMLRETTSETVVIKCIETIRKDMCAMTVPVTNKQNALTDTSLRVAEIEKQLQKL